MGVEQTLFWWNKYSALERDNVLDYYLYFYKDIRKDTFRILKDMIWFAGFDQFIDDALITDIIGESDIEKRRDKVAIINKGDICAFHSENTLYPETKRIANALMLDVLGLDLIHKFNESCFVTFGT